jgi:hypothetical protein
MDSDNDKAVSDTPLITNSTSNSRKAARWRRDDKLDPSLLLIIKILNYW